MELSVSLHFLATGIEFVEEAIQTMIFQQGDGGSEGDEVAQFAHINAIAVGVSDLGCRTDDDDLFGAESREHAYDAFLEGRTAHDGIIYDDEAIRIFSDGSVGDVVYVLHHFGTIGIFGDEGAHLYIFDGDLFDADLPIDHFGEFFLVEITIPGHDPLDLDLVEIVFHTL